MGNKKISKAQVKKIRMYLKFENVIKLLFVIGFMFILVWLSSKSIVYSLENRIPRLYLITKDVTSEAEVLKKAVKEEAFNYESPVEFVKEKDLGYINVVKGEMINLKTENLANMTPKEIKKEDVYIRSFKGLNEDTITKVNPESISINETFSANIKAPEEKGDYIYQIIINYDKRSVEYIYRIRVGE